MLAVEGKPPAEDLALIECAAREAGRIAARYFGRDPAVWYKEGASPVSEADYAVDRFLRETLLAARPHYGWLSEETADQPIRLDAPRIFIVDPIDGTRAFLEGKTTWCVSIGIVENGVPVAGVLDCPARDELYSGLRGGGATRNGRPLRVRNVTGEALVAGPKAILGEALGRLGRPAAPAPYIPSLAYRIAMVADGLIDATFIKPNAHDWDLAAADLLLNEAGGSIRDPGGSRPAYATPDPRHGALAAGSGPLLQTMIELIRA